MAPPEGAPLLLACDLDGTLLEEDGSAIPGAGEALRELIAAGALLAVVTGRPLHSARRAVDALGVEPVAFACYHGALVVDRAGEPLRHLPVPRAAARAIAAEALRHELGVTVYDWDEPRELSPDWSPGGDASGGPAGPGDAVSRLVLHGDPATATRLLGELRGPWSGRVRIEQIRPGFVGVFNAAADKGDALRLLAARLAVPLTRTAACGDSTQDESLLAAAAVAIAVGERPHALEHLPGVVITSRPHLAATLRARVLPLL